METGLKIPGYEIKRQLDEGGMATVFLAIQENLEREVALKVMSASLAADKTFCERFLNEGKIVAKLSDHEDIVSIYDIGFADPVYYMAMELIMGGSLKERIINLVGLFQAVDIIRHIASALGYAHEHGFVHRDVKPANVLFRLNGAATLTDFGIAKTLASETQLTQIGYAVGTPDYMSPEQIRGKPLDGRSDLYSLGIIFYELLAGKHPFTGRDSYTTAKRHIENPVPSLPDHLEEYQPVLNRLLAKKPDDRFATAEELIRALDDLAGGGKHDYEYDGAGQTIIAEVLEDEPSDVTSRGLARRMLAILPRWKIQVQTSLVISISIFLLLSSMVYFAYWQKDGLQDRDDFARDRNQVELTPELRDKVERMLRGADANLAIGRLREPHGSNAYDTYQQVLEMDPNNKKARRSLQQIEELEAK